MNTANQNARSKFFVFGTAHELQGKEFQMPIDVECYRITLNHLIAARNVDAVFEEASGRSPSYAQIIADSHSPKLSYIDVDPPRNEREQHGLASETGCSEPLDFFSQPPCVQRFEHVAKHADRERFWLTRITQCKFKSALFICGASHTLSFSFRLIDAGYEVEQCITYLPYDKLCRHVLVP
jgi:hypothetical protein